MQLELLKPPEFPAKINAKALFGSIFTASSSQVWAGGGGSWWGTAKQKFTLKGYKCIK